MVREDKESLSGVFLLYSELWQDVFVPVHVFNVLQSKISHKVVLLLLRVYHAVPDPVQQVEPELNKNKTSNWQIVAHWETIVS